MIKNPDKIQKVWEIPYNLIIVPLFSNYIQMYTFNVHLIVTARLMLFCFCSAEKPTTL